MNRTFLIVGALMGALAVALGAFGAHGLQNATSDEKILNAYSTGVEYQMYHALALLATSLIAVRLRSGLIKWAGNFFIIGIILFSGSLYAITAIKISGTPNVGKIGIITPIGGLFFIAGWIAMLIGAFVHDKVANN